MISILATLSTYLVASATLLGAFSRFTHGQYTPQWYAFQEYHSPDDGSSTAIITPYIDTLVGFVLLFGTRKLRLSAAGVSLLFFTLGLVMQVQAGKDYSGDVILVVLAATAVTGLFRR